MPLWGRNDADANTAPKFRAVAGANATCIQAFGNVTPSAIVANQAMGVFGVDTAETKASKMIVHPGWVIVRQGTGPVASLAVANGGAGYSNTDVVRVSGGVTNAAGTLVTNSTGGITSVVLGSGGGGFKSSPTTAVANSTGGASAGTGGVISAVLGGRAGRKHAETLVAMSSIIGDASDDTTLPDT